MAKSKKQRKRLEKMVGRLFRYDLQEVLVSMKESKNGKKEQLKQRVVYLIETKQQKDFIELKKIIKSVYKKNDKIKKSPKKNRVKRDVIQNSDKSYVTFENTSDSTSKQSNLDLSPNIDNSVESQTNSLKTTTIESWVNSYQSSQQLIQRNIQPFSSANDSQQPFNTSHANNQFTDFNSISQRNAFSVLNNSFQMSPNFPLFNPIIHTNEPNSGSFTNYRSQQAYNQSTNPYFSNTSSAIDSKFIAQNNSLNDTSNSCRTLESLIAQQNLLLPQSYQDRDLAFNEDYRFKQLHKFKQILKIEEPRIIASLSDIGIVNEFSISDLHIKVPQYNWYLSGSGTLSTSLRINGLQIQLRFCYITEINTCEQKDCCPEHLCIDVNGEKIYSYSESENICGPFDITSFCKLGSNVVKFWLDKTNFIWELPCAYEISIVKFYTPESFLNNLKQNNAQYLSPDFTKSLIKLKSHQSIDETAINITITDFNAKIKLICPLSCSRIETPCRTSECKHIECFDGYSFFKMNDLKYDWFCPICQLSASLDLLRIDGYFVDILQNTDSSITEVNFKNDGSYEPIIKKEINEIAVIELDDLIDDEIECTFSNVELMDDCIIID